MSYLTLFCITLMVLVIGEVSAQKWSASIQPSIGAGGKWEIKGTIGVSWRRKRDTQSGAKFSITLEINPCLFTSYDLNEDGNITKDEIDEVFQASELAEAFFNEGDDNNDGEINSVEFTALVGTIVGCYV